MRAADVMRRIAVISSDKQLERTLVPALRCAAGRGAEVVALSADADVAAAAARCDSVVVLGAAEFLAGRLSTEVLHGCGVRRPQIFVISWQLGEQTVLALLENGIDQYMTFPLNLRRLCMKIFR